MIRPRLLVIVAIAFGIVSTASAQPPQASPTERTPVPQTFTLEQAIAYAGEHYPTVRAALYQVSASEAGIAVARASYLPHLDALWQSNRGTAKNVFGQVLPQSVIPAMSGPVLTSPTGQSVWGSAAGALLSWEPIDFGLRSASVVGAQAAVTRARAGAALTRLEVQRGVAEAFLSVLTAEGSVRTAQADFERRDVLARNIRTLVDNQLRPGAESSRADAERAASQTRLILARAGEAVARATLSRLLTVGAGEVVIEAGELLDQVPPVEPIDATPPTHPLVEAHRAAIDEARAQSDILAVSNLPRLYLQSSLFARGSGAHPDGTLDGAAGGLRLERVNWAAGFQLVVPNVFDFASLRVRKAAADANERAQTALYDESVLTVSSEQRTAATMLQAARAVAANTPVQLAAAQQTESQARARYQSGLTSIIELTEAQSLLAQAEVQDQLARIDVWRALLAAAVARGDLRPFMTSVHPFQGAP
jgi:outer membrane protein